MKRRIIFVLRQNLFKLLFREKVIERSFRSQHSKLKIFDCKFDFELFQCFSPASFTTHLSGKFLFSSKPRRNRLIE